jgi:hypothetical protein
MQDHDPDEQSEQPDDFAEAFAKALEKVPPEDFARIRQEALNETHAEAMMGVGTPMWFPPEVLERILAYEKEHSIDHNKMIPVAIKSTRGRTEEVVEIGDQYFEDPDSFQWPVQDPLLCVLIAFLRAHASWLTKKINQEYGENDEDEGEPADWWKEQE